MLDAATPETGQEGGAEERPGVTVYCDERVQDGRCTRTSTNACARTHLEARRTDSDGLAAVVHPSNDVDLHPPLGGCYNARAAPREQRVQGDAGRGVRDV